MHTGVSQWSCRKLNFGGGFQSNSPLRSGVLHPPDLCQKGQIPDYYAPAGLHGPPGSKIIAYHPEANGSACGVP